MLSRLFWLLLVTTGLLLVSAAGCHLRARALTGDALALHAQSEQAAHAFSTTFQGDHQDQELSLLDQRRALLLRASDWTRGMLLCLGLSVLSLFSAWVMRELRAVRLSLDMDEPLGHP